MKCPRKDSSVQVPWNCHKRRLFVDFFDSFKIDAQNKSMALGTFALRAHSKRITATGQHNPYVPTYTVPCIEL